MRDRQRRQDWLELSRAGAARAVRMALARRPDARRRRRALPLAWPLAALDALRSTFLRLAAAVAGRRALAALPGVPLVCCPLREGCRAACCLPLVIPHLHEARERKRRDRKA
jgi:hypothetical protein